MAECLPTIDISFSTTTRYETPKLADGFELPSRIRVAPLLWGPSAGEDGRRLERDGWKLFRKRKEIEQCLAHPL